MITILESLTFQPELFYLLSFIFLLFAGEPIVLGFTFIATTLGMISVWQIFIFAILAAVVAELFWFFIAKTKFFRNHKLTNQFPSISKDIEFLIKKTDLNSPLKLLFFSRLISGAALLVIIVLSQRGLKLKKFVLYSIIVNLFWSSIIVTAGYLAATGYKNIFGSFLSITNFFEISFAILLLSYLIYRFTVRKLATKILD